MKLLLDSASSKIQSYMLRCFCGRRRQNRHFQHLFVASSRGMLLAQHTEFDNSGVFFRTFLVDIQLSYSPMSSSVPAANDCRVVLKGHVFTIFSDFLRFFCASKKWRLLASSVDGHQIWKLGRPRGLAACSWPPTLASWHESAPWTNDKSLSQSIALASTSVDGDRQHFCKNSALRGPSKVDIPRVQLIQDEQRQLYLSILYSGVWLMRAWPRACFDDLVAESYGWSGNEGLGSVVVAPFPVDILTYVCHCEGKCAERGSESLYSERDVDGLQLPTPKFVDWHFAHLSCDKDLEAQQETPYVVSLSGTSSSETSGRSRWNAQGPCMSSVSSSLPEGALLSTAHPVCFIAEIRRW